MRRHRLARDRARLVVAVSGGADSVALLDALAETGDYRLVVAHVHHGLRAAADEDARFVEKLAAERHLAFELARVDVPALARQWGVGEEEAARQARYAALIEIALRHHASAVAVAHHAGDQVETVLHRVARGTHWRGLAGMRPSRDLAPNLKLIRPLLWARREEIEEYLRSRGLSWRNDHTNESTDYTRNFIRHKVLPLLREGVNPQTDEAILRLAEAAREVNEVLDELIDRAYTRALRRQLPGRIELRIASLEKHPGLVIRMSLLRALEQLGAPLKEVDSDHVGRLIGVFVGAIPAADLPGGVHARRHGNDLVLTLEPPARGEGVSPS